jgi:two-component system, chemotaxis family, CheB/CheR fusion protein
MTDGEANQPSTQRELDLAAELRAARQARSALLAELQNRSRNTMSAIRSIIRRTASTSATVDDFAQHLEARVSAYSRAQGVVMHDPNATAEISLLLSEELLAHAVHESESVRIQGSEFRLQSRAAELFGLVFNELILNSIKYGALRSADGGAVVASWTVDELEGSRWLRFRWDESRLAVPPGKPGPGGFGTELIEKNLPYELAARSRLVHRSQGTLCEIDVPLSPRLSGAGQGTGGGSDPSSPPRSR